VLPLDADGSLVHLALFCQLVPWDVATRLRRGTALLALPLDIATTIKSILISANVQPSEARAQVVA
jgi:hypothetical protein